MADEQETTFAESTVAEPEIERAESSAAEDNGALAGCPVWMGDGDTLRCGRKLHVTPNGVDEVPVCLMHSKDPNKHPESLFRRGLLFDAFWLEFEGILKDAGANEAHFERFVFPQLDLIGRQFIAICKFRKATFAQEAHFSRAIFVQNANFVDTIFTLDANFIDAAFIQDADFNEAIFMTRGNFRKTTFTQTADFLEATFTHDADFSWAIFTGNSYFNKAVFEKDAEFSAAHFTKEARFCDAIFKQNAYFRHATFAQGANFRQATFTQDANLGGATFTQDSDFSSAHFKDEVRFSGATFMQTSRFVDTNFNGTANWHHSRFFDQAEFRRTKFAPQIAGQPSAVFALARFYKPGEIIFDDVDLSRALFHDCDVSQVWFASSARWGTRRNNHGIAVFEETIDLKQEYATGLERDGQRDYRAVEQIYHQLKKNYDSRLDFWTANEFHFGEMEMKRLAGPTGGRLLRLGQWLHRMLSLVALYRYASDYGNNFVKPMVWLLATLVLSAALLPIPGVGLMRQGSRQAETYASVWRTGDGWRPNLWAEARLAGKSVITSVDAATFQRSAEYAPAYPWGRVLAIFETLLTSTLFALFLLAIRRQFRR